MRRARKATRWPCGLSLGGASGRAPVGVGHDRDERVEQARVVRAAVERAQALEQLVRVPPAQVFHSGHDRAHGGIRQPSTSGGRLPITEGPRRAPSTMSFRTRLSLFFVTIVVVPVVTVALLLLGLSRDNQTGKADARIAQGLRTALAVYERQAVEARPTLKRVLSDPGLARGLTTGERARLRRRLGQLSRARGGLASIAVYAPDGRLLASAGDASAVASATAAPRGRGGRPLGVVAVSTTRAAAYAAEVERLTGLEARVSRDRALLASTLGRGDRKPVSPGELRVGGRLYRGRSLRVSGADRSPVAIGVFEESSGLTRAIARARTAVLGAVLVLIALALAFAIYIVRGLQAQIGEFLAAARRLRKGDFSRPVEAEGKDEFALLGKEFNKMSEQLSAKIEQVERERREVERTLRRVGEAFAAALDPDERLALALEMASDACAAEAARAVPSDRGKLRPARLGRDEPRLQAALELAESAALEIRRERARAPSDAATQPGRSAPVELAGVYALAAPLGAHDELGVISIARRGLAFSDSERDQFASLAVSAAVAIETANLHKTVEQQSVTDELTGLDNVRQFHRNLHGEVERSRRFATEVGLVMMDIDNFKRVNDSYGHQQGDLVLERVARVLRQVSRDIDQPARYGGEEMAIVLPQTDLEGAVNLAERVRAGIEALAIERVDGDGTVPVTASFGVSSLPESAGAEETLIAAADAALYRAKRAGKNRVERAEPVPAPR